ncbi:MAG: nickel-binding protein [Planctomycetaceae bacterium]
MPTFMDRHDLPGLTAEQVAEMHVKDLQIQDDHGVRFLTYWCDEDRGSTFCLVDGPSAARVEEAHRASHGEVPHKILEVDQRAVTSFLGSITDPDAGSPWAASAFRTIMFTDIVGSTSMLERIGDVAAKELVLSLDAQIHDLLDRFGGSWIGHTGDGVVASFASAADALACAVALQRAVDARTDDPAPLQLRIGLAAGEPIAEGDRLFGATLNLAARLCAAAAPATIYVPASIRELVLGKRFTFLDRGQAMLKGFSEPVQLFEVPWAENVPAELSRDP